MNREIIKQIEHLLGGTKALAEIAGVSSQSVSQWKQIPPKHVMKIERALDCRITRYQMRPDIYN